MYINQPLALLIKWLLAATSLVITTYLVPGFRVKDFKSAMIAAFFIGIANITIQPILYVLTLPLTILTLGLFTFVVNAIVLRICAALLEGFQISGWISSIMGAVVLSLVSTGINLLI